MTVIVLSGPIGAGKSSLTGILADYLGTKPFYESVDDNPVLPLFYADPKKYAFLLQVYFLNTRFHSIKDALTEDNNVLDRSIYEDALFFQMNADIGRATSEEVDTYYELLHNMMRELDNMPKKRPDLLVHIKVSYNTMIKRIQKRGRPYEQLSYDATLEDYYKRLLRYYKPWYKKYNYSPKMVIDGDKLDFMTSEKDRQIVLDQIVAKLKEMGKLPKDWDKPTDVKIKA
ncbi:deoxynucleoside kinase [Lactobacillus acetotolerans]|jgi:deoxyadenosine/deoxycytidine kinase|uniref:Deoxyguanosine kinase n=1 Tax=Lactobacillus acetotolerans TaxID=1600 RepID=A0A0D6A6F7_9LACO|nr:deoxynucleoside kinase [Lactobacillus acetotolerans]KRN41794.1 deoxyguanosine kinase [Lactobacillus acetotolerans DSM 20749 = JCM 3825]QFG51944.1 deoxynucleoside kinase [Lactobacillus acetotolerans]QGV05334.1 deoxynucleoside kinase [Lactobacillus acetotolerans]QJD72867.1 deoxynucleoside kinase [Lactobacillus acetotolerans]BAQ58030.1 deoxyguanosine kinase [Lactobacillus acetotolerans]